MSLKKKYLSIKLFSPFRKTMNHFPINGDHSDRVKSQEIELEHCRDVILKLKKQLYDTKNEVQLLKINKIILENEHYKTINHLKVFLKTSDPAEREKYKTIEQNTNYNLENDDFIEKSQNTEDNAKLPNEIEDNIVISKRTMLNRRRNKNKIQNYLKLDSLRQHIYSLNEELTRKNNLITELQNNKKVRGYQELQKSLIKNCNQINEKLHEENYEIRNKYDALLHLLKTEQNDNKLLKEKLKKFNQRFMIFKELSINKVKKLDEELNIAKEKERNLNIKIIGEQDKEKIENHNKNEEYNNMKNKIDKYEIEIKKNSDLIKKYKNENMGLKEENKKYKKEKEMLIIKNEKLMKENEEMKIKIKQMNKKISELENNIKNRDKIFFTDVDKVKINTSNKKDKNIIKEEKEYDDFEEEKK